MRKKGLRDLIGSTVVLRPSVQRMPRPGVFLKEVQDKWLVGEPRDNGGVVSLRNVSTGHRFDLGADNVFEYRSSGHVILKVQLTLTPREIVQDPLPDSRARFRPPPDRGHRAKGS